MLRKPKVITHIIALTWSPDRKLFATFKRPLLQIFEHFRRVIANLRLCSRFDCYPEMHVSGDLHYHFTVYIWDDVKWFRKVLPSFKHHGFIKAKLIDQQTDALIGWQEYCSKQKPLMEHVLRMRLPIESQKGGLYDHRTYWTIANAADVDNDV
jgi:hypothetical protein